MWYRRCLIILLLIFVLGCGAGAGASGGLRGAAEPVGGLRGAAEPAGQAAPLIGEARPQEQAGLVGVAERVGP